MKSLNKKNALLLAISSLALATPALANEGKDAEAKFRAMDENDDKKISSEEYAGAKQKYFEKMDANKDQKVTAEEMTAAWDKDAKEKKIKVGARSPKDKIGAMDTDKDGTLSSTENTEGYRLQFQKLDTDKDGYLSKSEFEAGLREQPKQST